MERSFAAGGQCALTPFHPTQLCHFLKDTYLVQFLVNFASPLLIGLNWHHCYTLLKTSCPTQIQYLSARSRKLSINSLNESPPSCVITFDIGFHGLFILQMFCLARNALVSPEEAACKPIRSSSAVRYAMIGRHELESSGRQVISGVV